MTITRKLTAVTAVLAIAGTGVAAAAMEPIVSPQKTSASHYSPVLIPGTGIKKGERLPSGARIIYRDVTLQGKQEVSFTLRAPAGKRMRALADNGGGVGYGVTSRGSYSGHKQASLRAFTAPRSTGEFTSRIYGLVR